MVRVPSRAAAWSQCGCVDHGPRIPGELHLTLIGYSCSLRFVTDAEWDILEVLWRLERATSSQVAEALVERRGWAPSTVRTFLARMKDKGMLEADRVGKNWVYRATSDPTETRRSAWQSFAQTAFGSVGGALRFLAKDAKLTRVQKTRLLEMLEGKDD